MDLMNILAWVLIGFIAGSIAKFAMPGNDRGGFLTTMILGIVGAAVGGWLGNFLGWRPVTSFDIRSILVAAAGAFVVLFIFRMLTGRRV